jgi:hypothetical protein
MRINQDFHFGMPSARLYTQSPRLVNFFFVFLHPSASGGSGMARSARKGQLSNPKLPSGVAEMRSEAPMIEI